MTAWLIRHFIKDYQNVTDNDVRERYGTLASVTGILVNVLLAALKFLMGLLSGSLAVMADAANNLSDAAGSIVTLITVRLATSRWIRSIPLDMAVWNTSAVWAWAR